MRLSAIILFGLITALGAVYGFAINSPVMAWIGALLFVVVLPALAVFYIRHKRNEQNDKT